jgi:hypothetical protein
MADSRMYEGCSKSIRPLAGKNTFTCLEGCNPNPLQSSLIVTEHTSPSSSAIMRSISEMPLCEWSTAWPSYSIWCRLMTQIESLSAMFSGGRTAKNRKEPCRQSRGPVKPQEYCVWPRKFWISCKEWAGALSWCSHVSRTLSAWTNHRSKWNVQSQCLSPPPPQVLRRWHNGPAWPKSAVGQWAHHFSLRAYWNERRYPPIWGHLWIGLQLLNLCDAHGIVAENPLIFRMVSTWLSPSFWQNLMQWRCSSRSVIFAESNNAMHAAYTLSLTRWLHATDAVCWQGGGHVCVWRSPPPSYHSTPPVLHWFSQKKNHIGYFLNRSRILHNKKAGRQLWNMSDTICKRKLNVETGRFKLWILVQQEKKPQIPKCTRWQIIKVM